jgi:glycosyltransferase involved in cell wall biosynthesis
MSAGLIVLGSSASGSVVDRVINGKNGWVHTVGNAEQLAGHISHLANELTSIRVMQAAARETAEMWPVKRGLDILWSCLQPIMRSVR